MAENLTAFIFINKEIPLPILKEPKAKATLNQDYLYSFILKILGVESKRQV